MALYPFRAFAGQRRQRLSMATDDFRRCPTGAHYAYAVVVMPQPVSDAANVTPVDIGAEFRCEFAELCRRFADDEQRVLHCENFLFIRNEAFKVQARSKPFDPGYVVEKS